MDKLDLRVLSLGGGVQTAALALMMDRRELSTPAPTFAVFADTHAEPPHVYETLDWLEGLVGFPIFRASAGNLERDTVDSIQGRRTWRGMLTKTDLPLHSAIGSGMTQRQCTAHYKINVIKRAIRDLAGPISPPHLTVTQYLGVSLDEAHRMKGAREKYITNAYPLIDDGLTRSDCISYLDERHPGHPVGKSACYFCPFHSKAEWLALSAYPVLKAKAIEMDDALRNSPEALSLVRHKRGLRGLYEDSEMQHSFADEFGNECEGVCGV